MTQSQISELYTFQPITFLALPCAYSQNARNASAYMASPGIWRAGLSPLLRRMSLGHVIPSLRPPAPLQARPTCEVPAVLLFNLLSCLKLLLGMPLSHLVLQVQWISLFPVGTFREPS